MLNQADFSDITLVFDGTQIPCHQVILASRSLYFEALLSHDFKEKEQRVVTFSSATDCVGLESFMLMLKLMYSDTAVKIETKHLYDLLSVRNPYPIDIYYSWPTVSTSPQ
jgi:BTB/POZ domain